MHHSKLWYITRMLEFSKKVKQSAGGVVYIFFSSNQRESYNEGTEGDLFERIIFG